MKSLLKQILPLFAALAIFLLTTNEFIVTGVIALMIVATFLIHREQGEWKVVVLGIILGIVFELAGDAVYQAQYWESATLLSIPLWLPLMWGYGFIFIRRIGNILVKKS
jgi:4-hydroxybenzoate polyprenyltransferase